MSVIGTPASTSTVPAPPSSCAAVTVQAPIPTQQYGQSISGRMESVEVNQGQIVTISWTMRDKAGNPVDLTSCGSSVVLTIREALGNSQNLNTTVITGTISRAVDGTVSATLTSAVVAYPGISIGEFAIYSGSSVLIFSNQFYLVVNRGLYGAGTTAGGPPTLAEIRLHLRDSSPEDNFLLDAVEFDSAEIAACIVRPVQQYNDMPPPIDQQYNTSTFKWRHYWLEAISANLLFMAAAHYRRNKLAYSAGGMSIDDKNKEKEYMEAAMLHKKSWEEWAKMNKVNENMEAGFSQVLSGYSYFSWPTN